MAWQSDSSSFVTAGVDKRIHLWDMKGALVHSWTTDIILDVHISIDGARMVAITATNKILIYNMRTREREGYTHDNFHCLVATLSSMVLVQSID